MRLDHVRQCPVFARHVVHVAEPQVGGRIPVPAREHRVVGVGDFRGGASVLGVGRSQSPGRHHDKKNGEEGYEPRHCEGEVNENEKNTRWTTTHNSQVGYIQ